MLLHHAKRLLLAVGCVFAMSSGAWAQEDNTNINFAQPIAGVEIDAAGVLRIQRLDHRIANERLAAARQKQGAAGAELRKVSLNRLEKAVVEAIAAGQKPSEEMLSMAGLTGIQYVFFYPETNDIVVAGPAQGAFRDPMGRFLGTRTGEPIVQLEDMVSALRAYRPGIEPTRTISVSIDPTADGLKRMQRYLASLGGIAQPGQEAFIASNLQQNLGLQTVSLKGVPFTTNFARVLVEADYRMKMIGIGLERVPGLASFTDRSFPGGSANALQRWFFIPNYEGVTVSEDGLAMKLNDRGVKLVGESELVNSSGERAAGGRVNRASQGFCNDFTKNYDQIARMIPVYAELRNLIDVSIAAAYIQKQDFYGQAGWEMPVFGDESRFAIETHDAPQQVETAVNAVWKNGSLLTPIGGGINMQPRQALTKERLLVETDGKSDAVKRQAAPVPADLDRWWWD
jgi:hypothetical protein